jgi:hypothetical protein
MLIRISSRLLNDVAWYPFLDVLVNLVEHSDGRHTFDTSQYKELAASGWLTEATGGRRTTAEVIRKSSTAASREVPSDAVTLKIDDRAALTGTTQADTQIDVHPFGALILLTQPFYLIVEDESSDGAFVLWVARALGRDRIWRAYRAGQLAFRHAGGKGQFVKSARAITYGVWPDERRPILAMRLRTAAMLDSDAQFSGDTPNAGIISAVSEHVAFVHALQARTIENYIPRKYLSRYLGQPYRSAVDAFFRMAEQDRNLFPMKKGFVEGTKFPSRRNHGSFCADGEVEGMIRAQYQSVNATDWTLIAGGFGDSVGAIYSDPAHRCNPGEQGQLTPNATVELNGFLTRVIKYL